MRHVLDGVGTVLGVLGLLVCGAAGSARVAGYYHLAGFEAATLFTAGIALMVAACLAKLQALSQAAAQRG
jgi:hypothetical protein